MCHQVVGTLRPNADLANSEPLAEVIPLGIFDPFEEAKKPW